MTLVLVGLSHHTAPIEVRERVACPEHALPHALAALRELPGLQETVLVSTCNRLEIYGLLNGYDAPHGYALLSRHLAQSHALPEGSVTPFLYRKAEQDAVQHLLRVTGGLDSLVLGDGQILGQVREAFRAAQKSRAVGSILSALFQQAITGARRIQNETELARGAFSIGHAAVDLATQIFADLSRATVLLLGAGKMSELTAKHLQASGVRFIVVANRTYEKAQQMAQRLGGEAIHYDTFPERLATADIVISSTAAPHPVIYRETLQPILRKRRGKPLFLIDIALPRDIAPDVYNLENVFLYNIDDLQAVVAEAARERAVEAQRAERIVGEETEKFLTWYRGREAVPVISQLRERLERIRQDDLTLLRSRLPDLSERDWQAIETATRAMMNRIAREPILRLKSEMETPEPSALPQYDLLSATCELFGLQTEQAEPTEANALPENVPVEEERTSLPTPSSRPWLNPTEVG